MKRTKRNPGGVTFHERSTWVHLLKEKRNTHCATNPRDEKAKGDTLRAQGMYSTRLKEEKREHPS